MASVEEEEWLLEVGDDGLEAVQSRVDSDADFGRSFPWPVVLKWLEGPAKPGTFAGKAYADYPKPLTIQELHAKAAITDSEIDRISALKSMHAEMKLY